MHDVHDVLLDLLVHVHLAHQLAGGQHFLRLHHHLGLGHSTGPHVLADDELLLIRLGVVQHHLQHEAVGLSLGQGIGALLFDRVHGGQHQEGLRQVEGLLTDGDLAFLHGLQQRALHLGGCPVDLVGQDEVAEERTLLHAELLVLLAVDQRADQVGRQEVGRELDPAEIHVDGLCQGLDRERLGQTGYAFQQDMPIGQQGHEQLLHHVLLAHDHLLHLAIDQVHEGAGVLDAFVQLPDAVGGDGAGRRCCRGGGWFRGMLHVHAVCVLRQSCPSNAAR